VHRGHNGDDDDDDNDDNDEDKRQFNVETKKQLSNNNGMNTTSFCADD
jgi:hypothetical protein